jgi:hypothetical protein
MLKLSSSLSWLSLEMEAIGSSHFYFRSSSPRTGPPWRLSVGFPISWLVQSSIMFPTHVAHSLALQSPRCYLQPSGVVHYRPFLSSSLRHNIFNVTHCRGPIGLHPIIPDWDSWLLISLSLSISFIFLGLVPNSDLLLAHHARATLPIPVSGGEEAISESVWIECPDNDDDHTPKFVHNDDLFYDCPTQDSLEPMWIRNLEDDVESVFVSCASVASGRAIDLVDLDPNNGLDNFNDLPSLQDQGSVFTRTSEDTTYTVSVSTLDPDEGVYEDLFQQPLSFGVDDSSLSWSHPKFALRIHLSSISCGLQ